ncbi:cell surface hyaluronidase isoform X2 [Ictalurus furcatus]|nr:cell surface hyaluronidase isoform X2 [Ictalurus furcatus]XP_053510043.1 cell surface hyaluronidase isoform X2 [Ictalurus furcatus]
MQGNRGPGRLPQLVTPSNGSAPYTMTRVVPVRSPPPVKALPPPPARPKPLAPPPARPPAVHLPEIPNWQQRKNTYICTGVFFGLLFFVIILVLSLSSSQVLDKNCPDHNLTLSDWNPGQNPKKAVVVRNGQLFKLTASATLHSLTIQSGGSVVFADNKEGSNNITLRTHYILIEEGGALHVGAPKCRYRSHATITLMGRSDDASVSPVPGFGRKFVGVRPGGTLELHGLQRPSWTLLTRTVPATGLAAGSYAFQRNFSRGINLRVVDQDTGALLSIERFDTHDSQNDSRKLTQMLQLLPRGRIVALAVGDSAAKSLLDETKNTIQGLLGSRHVRELKYRQAWALVSVVGGGNSSCVEEVREHENHDTGGKALARRDFVTVDGVRFFVSAYSEWWNGYPISGFQVDVVDQVILNVQDDVSSWRPGDRIVVASTDYSMHQAEEFTLLPCPHCTKTQLRIQGKPQFTHMGEIVDGVDMRAEVALLSRNILIHGEIESSCYGNNWCQYYTHDTFGGHVKILGNFSSVHMSQVELKHMGQQAERDSHPVHFHMCGDVDEGRAYLDSLSIHHSFSRCVSIHATNGLLVRDTVGYDTLGHCFFLADGIEQRNTFYHNLGLVTKPGTILPTERNDTMCTKILDRVHPGYVPSPATECKAVSTFWIANPNNNLINNAAAGSQDAGIWYIFHNSSTGDSHGLVTETKAELTPLGIFYNNRVHSNFKAGLFIDKGVKTSNASAADPREYLCLDNNARFRPHENSDPTRLRVAALIDTLISFKNNDLGAWIRGGDIIIRNSGFADNGVGLSFASDGSYPKDVGSSQEVSESIFVGESGNRGTNGGQNKYWGVGGVDGNPRTLPRNKTFPIRGFQIYDGPVRLMRSTFRSYTPTPDRFTTAVGFSLKNAWQLTPRNNLSSLSFLPSVTLRAFFGRPGQWFEDNDLDGDKNSIFHDLDGSVSGYPDVYVVRADNFLLQHRDCVKVPQWNGCVCSGRYAQVYIKTQGVPNLSLSIIRDEYPDKPLVLRGINSQTALSQQYQPVLMLSKSYTLHWNGRAPKEIVLLLANFDPGDWALFGLCYPPDTVFQVMSDIYDRQNNVFDGLEDYGSVSSLAELEKHRQDRKYFFDRDAGLLWLYTRARHPRNGHSYCSTRGCERVKIIATMSTKQTTCNCTAAAYPKYTKDPSASVPMPAPVTQPCNKCGASKLVFSSDPWNSYLQTQIKSLSVADEQKNDTRAFITVNSKQFNLSKTGFLAVTVDACTGKVLKNVFFLKRDSKMEQYFRAEIPARSILLLASRGQPDEFAGVAQYLVPLGAAKVADLQGKGSLSFFGFQGASSPPPWVSLQVNRGQEVVEKYIPLSLDEYSCTRDAEKPQRKDLELLRKARS